MHASTLPFGQDALRRLRPVLRGTCRACFDPGPRFLRGTAFALSSDEHRFALGLLDGPEQAGLRKHNLWLFRPDQTCRAGDFVLVDVSPPPRGLPSWDAFVLELKMGEPLRIGGGSVGLQLLHADAAAHLAVREAARTHRAVRAEPRLLRRIVPRRVIRIVGSREATLDFFAACGRK